jgi:hypothetical protein
MVSWQSNGLYIYIYRERENIVQMACTVDCVLAINGELQSNGIYIYIYREREREHCANG